MHLKTKYSNEDGRFKIDDRFVDGSSSSSASSSEAESASDDEDPDKRPQKKKKLPSEKSVKKKLKKETQTSLDILATITGKSIRRHTAEKHNADSDDETGDKTVNTAQKMVRYDPTKEEHKIFELLSDNDEYESEISKLKSKKESKPEAVELPDTNKNTDTSQYTQIESNLKELFCSKDVFKFKFDNLAEAAPKNGNFK